MARDLALLLALTVLGAAWLLCHLLLWGRVLRCRNVPLALRLLSWLPPLLPFTAWRARARTAALIWLVLGLAYGCLRTLA